MDQWHPPCTGSSLDTTSPFTTGKEITMPSPEQSNANQGRSPRHNRFISTSTLLTACLTGLPGGFALADNITELPASLFTTEIPEGFVQTVRRELSEASAVNADFLNPNYNPNIYLGADAQVTLNFIDEGAGFRNSLGYFTFQNGIFDSLTHGQINTDGYKGVSLNELSTVPGVNYGLVFPNSSRTGGGGNLNAGDSVMLGDGEIFSAGTNVGFFLLQNAWKDGTVNGYSPNANDALTLYSLDMLNPENNASATINTPSDVAKSRHVAMLFDGPQQDAIIMGFEDLHRTNRNQNDYRARSDNDFNDAIFRVSTNPVEAIRGTRIPTAVPSLPDRPLDVFQVQICDYSANAIEEYLPERTNVNAEFLNPVYDPNLVINQTTQVAVSFNDEGASFQNSLGYFTYTDDTFSSLAHGAINADGNQGVSLRELESIDGVDIGMVFAKASAQGKGGRLEHGDSVLLGGGEAFDAGTRIGFFLVQDGWTGDHVAGYQGDDLDPLVFYTLDMLNPENAEDADLDTDSYEAFSRHVAMLFANEARESIVMGFEDLHRTDADLNVASYTSDEDFNDHLFCVWSLQSQALSDTQIMVSEAAAYVPEPASLALISTGFFCLRRRRNG